MSMQLNGDIVALPVYVNAPRRARRSRRPRLTSSGPMSRLPAPATGDVSENGDFVANTKSAEKAAGQAEKHRARNVALRSRMRTAVRSVTAAISGGDKEAARTSYQKAVPVIDSLVSKQIVHRNKAARHKSRLAARIRAM
jgi:small subunit ribosomal protein S20